MTFHNPREIIATIHTKFTEKEISHLYLDAGASMVLHGIKNSTNDLDIFVDDLDVFIWLAGRMRAIIERGYDTDAYRIKLGDDIEVFTMTDADRQRIAACTHPFEVRENIRHSSIETLRRWYEHAVKTFGMRQKDIDSLALVTSWNGR